MDILNFENISALLKTGTGIDYSPEYLEKILGDHINTEYKLNRKFGVKREDYTLPERFQKEPLKEGPTKGSTVNIQKMVNEYYKIHKWEE
jgi:aldehyde:ferredoxin oxidoreductase